MGMILGDDLRATSSALNCPPACPTLQEWHVREKRAVQQTSYYPMLLPEFELYGIKPSGGALDAATSCVCAKKPSSKVRKSLDMYVSWNDSLKDLRSRKLVWIALQSGYFDIIVDS